MTIQLSQDLEQFVHDAVHTGRYASDDDVIRDALNRLRQAMSEESEKPGRTTRQAKPVQRKPMTIEELHQKLLAEGRISRLPDTAADFDDPDEQPVTIEGEPLSETIIRERR
jgi:putative addiction module CopG family antidote